MKRIYVIVFLLVWVISFSAARETEDIFSQAVGARARSLGSAYVALADDLTYAFWNPAGINLQQKSGYSFHYFNNYGLSQTFAGTLLNEDNTSLSIFGEFISELEAYDTYGSYLENYDDIYFNGAFTFGNRLNKNIFWGINIRGVYRKLYHNNYFGGTIDLGLLGSINDNLAWGCSLSNAFSKIISEDVSDYFPGQIAAGISFWPFKKNDTLLFTIAILMPLSEVIEEPNYQLGIEYWLLPEQCALRLGWNTIYDLTLGLGVNFADFAVDYVYFNHEYLGNSQQLSLLIFFAENQSARIKEKPIVIKRSYVLYENIFILPEVAPDKITDIFIIVDGTKKLTVQGSYPWYITLDDPSWLGKHTLEIIARKNNGKFIQKSMIINVENPQ